MNIEKMSKFYALPIILFLLACKPVSNDVPVEYSFISEIYPYTDTIYATHVNIIPFFTFGQKNNDKIVFYLDGDCSACYARIIEWQKFIVDNGDLLSEKNIQTALIIHTEKLDMLEYNLESIPNLLPIYVDTAQYFATYNSIPLLKSSVTLLDSNNIVLYSSLNKSKANTNHYKELVKVIKRR